VNAKVIAKGNFRGNSGMKGKQKNWTVIVLVPKEKLSMTVACKGLPTFLSSS
jgi:hypothetical protein